MPVAIHQTDTKRLRMLEEALESIRAQKHEDYEVVLKDAFPQEPVKNNISIYKLMREFGSKMHYVAYADKGMTDGLNQALYWSTGDILHIVCGDDSLGKDTDILGYVDRNFQVDSSKPQWMYGSTGCLLEDSSEGPWGITPYATLEEMLIHNRCGTPATYWNRAMFEKIGYFQYKLASDYDYWCRCYRVAPPIYTQSVLGCGRRWDEAASWIDRELVEAEAHQISVYHRLEGSAAPEYILYP
jgi:hypothetical protein